MVLVIDPLPLSSPTHRLKITVIARLDEVRDQADSLDKAMAAWADSTRVKLMEMSATTSKYSGALTSHIATVSAHMTSSTDEQLERLRDHRDTIQMHLAQEKKVLAETSEKLTLDIAEYVRRMVNDFTTQTVRRTETATADFDLQAETIADETIKFAAHQKKEFERVTSDNQTWLVATEATLENGRKANASQHATATGTLKKAVAETDAAQASLEAGCTASDTLAAKHCASTMKVRTTDSASCGSPVYPQEHLSTVCTAIVSVLSAVCRLTVPLDIFLPPPPFFFACSGPHLLADVR